MLREKGSFFELLEEIELFSLNINWGRIFASTLIILFRRGERKSKVFCLKMEWNGTWAFLVLFLKKAREPVNIPDKTNLGNFSLLLETKSSLYQFVIFFYRETFYFVWPGNSSNSRTILLDWTCFSFFFRKKRREWNKNGEGSKRGENLPTIKHDSIGSEKIKYNLRGLSSKDSYTCASKGLFTEIFRPC